MDNRTASIHKCIVYSDVSNKRNNFSIWINMQLFNNFFFLNSNLLIHSDSTLIQIGWTFKLMTFLNGNFSDLWRWIKNEKKTNKYLLQQSNKIFFTKLNGNFSIFVFTATSFQNIANHDSFFLFCLWITTTSDLVSHSVVMWMHW